MQRIKSANHLDGQVLFDLPQGDYEGLYIRFAGTNLAGQTLAATELGSVRIQHRNQEIVNVRSSYFIDRTNLYDGTPESASAIGAAYTFSFKVPFRTKMDRTNVLPVQPGNTSLTISGYNIAKVASGTIEIYALYSEGTYRYVPVLKEANISFSAAATRDITYSQPFIEELHTYESANLSTLTLFRDGVGKVDGAVAAVAAYSDATNRVETGVTLIEVIAQRSEFFQNVKETQIVLVATAAIAEQVTVYFAILPYVPQGS